MTPRRSNARWWVAALAAVALLAWVVLRPSPPPGGEPAVNAAPTPTVRPRAPVSLPAAAAPRPSAPPVESPPVESPPRRPAPLAVVDPMERLRAIVDSDPVAALALAQEEAQRSPKSPVADERSFYTMQALVHLGQISAARGEATTFFEKHPESPWGERVERLTGVHPQRYYQNAR